MKGLKSSRLWKNCYVRAAILAIVVMGSLVAFWFGLKIVLRAEFPLLSVDSTGMRPALNFGDLVMVQGVLNVSEINALSASDGDIVVFFKPSEPNVIIMRRAIHITFQDNAWYIRTKADENNDPDRWPSGQNAGDTWGDGLFHEKFLIGKVVGKIPYLGYIPLYVSAFLRTPAAMFLFIALMFLVVLITYPSLLKKKTKTQAKVSSEFFRCYKSNEKGNIETQNASGDLNGAARFPGSENYKTMITKQKT